MDAHISVGPAVRTFRAWGLVATLGAIAGFAEPSLATSYPDPGTQKCSPTAAPDPFVLYGDAIAFEVLRDGDPVGMHHVRFTRDGEILRTRTRFDVQVDVLFFTAYRYVYTSEATWRYGCLLSLTSTVDDNGEKLELSVARESGKLVIDGPDGRTETPAATLPTEHWNARVVKDRAVINTITGRVNAVFLKSLGVDRIDTRDGVVDAHHFAYSGELSNEVWYDEEGRWVKMRFSAKDGSTIEYVCLRCGLKP